MIPILLGVVGIVLAFTIPADSQCQGSARCFAGKVTDIIDGDTLDVDGQTVRLALLSVPETYEEGGEEATQFIKDTCPIDSIVLVDEDDGQSQGSYGRILAIVYCNGKILNQAVLDSNHGVLLDEFCGTSEFASSRWAQEHGC